MMKHTQAVAGLLAISVICGATANAHPAPSQQHGAVYKSAAAPITVKPGQSFTLALRANYSTPYQWKLARPLNRKVVQLQGTRYQTDAHPASMTGVPGTDFWTFKAVAPGTTHIKLGEVHVAEPKKFSKVRTFTVIVKSAAARPARPR